MLGRARGRPDTVAGIGVAVIARWWPASSPAALLGGAALLAALAVVVVVAALWRRQAPPPAPCGQGRDLGGEVDPEVVWSVERPVSADGAVDAGRFGGPFGVHTAPDGRLVVADDLAHRIVVLDRDGRLERVLGREDRGDGEVAWVDAVWVAPDGRLYVADTGNDRIQVWGPDGAFVRAWGKAAGLWASGTSLENPRDVAIDEDGLIWVADFGGDAIQVFDAGGAPLRRIGRSGGGLGELSGPVQLALGPDRLVYVSDSRNARIQVFTRDGAFVRCFGDQGPRRLRAPHGLAFGPEGRLWVVDRERHAVHVFDPGTGDLHSTAGREGSGRGQLSRPTDLCFSRDESLLYVVDAGNRRLVAWQTPQVAPADGQR